MWFFLVLLILGLFCRSSPEALGGRFPGMWPLDGRGVNNAIILSFFMERPQKCVVLCSDHTVTIMTPTSVWKLSDHELHIPAQPGSKWPLGGQRVQTGACVQGPGCVKGQKTCSVRFVCFARHNHVQSLPAKVRSLKTPSNSSTPQDQYE